MKRILPLIIALSIAPSAWSADADSILRGMSRKLAASKSFTFEAVREVDAPLSQEQAVPEKARVSVAVLRPDKLAGVALSRDGTRRVVSDGRRLTVIDEAAGYYSQVPMRANLDQLVEALGAVYGFTPPLVEFALSDVHADLRRQARGIAYLGKDRVGGLLGLGGVECHRIGLTGRTADAELWIDTRDQLPRKLVATFREPGQPQVRVTFSSWNLAAPLKSTDFISRAATRSARVEMWTEARMNTARNR